MLTLDWLRIQFPFLVFGETEKEGFIRASNPAIQSAYFTLNLNHPKFDWATTIKTLEEKNKNAGKQRALMESFRNLYFRVYKKYVAVWVKRNGRDGESLGKYEPWKRNELGYLDKLAAKAIETDRYICSDCKELHKRNVNVFAGYYCAECEKKSRVQNLLRESQRPGFYD